MPKLTDVEKFTYIHDAISTKIKAELNSKFNPLTKSSTAKKVPIAEDFDTKNYNWDVISQPLEKGRAEIKAAFEKYFALLHKKDKQYVETEISFKRDVNSFFDSADAREVVKKVADDFAKLYLDTDPEYKRKYASRRSVLKDAICEYLITEYKSKVVSQEDLQNLSQMLVDGRYLMTPENKQFEDEFNALFALTCKSAVNGKLEDIDKFKSFFPALAGLFVNANRYTLIDQRVRQIMYAMIKERNSLAEYSKVDVDMVALALLNDAYDKENPLNIAFRDQLRGLCQKTLNASVRAEDFLNLDKVKLEITRLVIDFIDANKDDYAKKNKEASKAILTAAKQKITVPPKRPVKEQPKKEVEDGVSLNQAVLAFNGFALNEQPKEESVSLNQAVVAFNGFKVYEYPPDEEGGKQLGLVFDNDKNTALTILQVDGENAENVDFSNVVKAFEFVYGDANEARHVIVSDSNDDWYEINSLPNNLFLGTWLKDGKIAVAKDYEFTELCGAWFDENNAAKICYDFNDGNGVQEIDLSKPGRTHSKSR